MRKLKVRKVKYIALLVFVCLFVLLCLRQGLYVVLSVLKLTMWVGVEVRWGLNLLRYVCLCLLAELASFDLAMLCTWRSFDSGRFVLQT